MRKDKLMEVYRRMRFALPCDRRTIDGVIAARFLKALKDLLAAPDTLLGGPEGPATRESAQSARLFQKRSADRRQYYM